MNPEVVKAKPHALAEMVHLGTRYLFYHCKHSVELVARACEIARQKYGRRTPPVNRSECDGQGYVSREGPRVEDWHPDTMGNKVWAEASALEGKVA